MSLHVKEMAYCGLLERRLSQYACSSSTDSGEHERQSYKQSCRHSRFYHSMLHAKVLHKFSTRRCPVSAFSEGVALQQIGHDCTSARRRHRKTLQCHALHSNLSHSAGGYLNHFNSHLNCPDVPGKLALSCHVLMYLACSKYSFVEPDFCWYENSQKIIEILIIKYELWSIAVYTLRASFDFPSMTIP